MTWLTCLFVVADFGVLGGVRPGVIGVYRNSFRVYPRHRPPVTANLHEVAFRDRVAAIVRDLPVVDLLCAHPLPVGELVGFLLKLRCVMVTAGSYLLRGRGQVPDLGVVHVAFYFAPDAPNFGGQFLDPVRDRHRSIACGGSVRGGLGAAVSFGGIVVGIDAFTHRSVGAVDRVAVPAL